MNKIGHPLLADGLSSFKPTILLYMRLRVTGILLVFIIHYSCKITEQQLPGTYKPGKNSSTRLILGEDHRYELALLDPKLDTLLFSNTGQLNFYTTGSWSLKPNKTLELIPDPGSLHPANIEDSISRFTNISSFNFWNRFGEPVSIRYIRIPPGRPKPHFGNGLYFFSQDFTATDTLRFYFDGYEAVSYPGSIHSAIGNNIHKVTLIEPHRAQVYNRLIWQVKGKRLKLEGNKTTWQKK